MSLADDVEKIIVIREGADVYCLHYPDGTIKGGLFKHQIGGYIDDYFHRNSYRIDEQKFKSDDTPYTL